jgi:hypothetical protein
MYNGSNHFGRAYQEELLRVAGVGEEQAVTGRRKKQSREPGLLTRLLSGLFGRRKESQPSLPELSRERQSLLGR